MDDLISRQAAIDHLKKRLYETALNNNTEHPYYEEIADNRVDIWMNEVPSAQPVAKDINVPVKDCISRQDAIDAINHICPVDTEYDCTLLDRVDVRYVLSDLPSAQPEIKPIEYRDCANAMLVMWMDKVVTDGEYGRIMDKLNAYWRAKNG